MSKYTTGEIAKLCEVSVRTVQYYDTRGILVPTELSEGGRRLYSDEDLAKMKMICYLKNLGLSLNNIAKLMLEDNSLEVIALIIEEHMKELEEEVSEKKAIIEKLEELSQLIKKSYHFSVKSFNDIAYVVDNKKYMKKVHTTMILAGIPMAIIEWTAIILWIVSDIWWPFIVYTVCCIPFGIWISKYYYKNTLYICPSCHEVFKPTFKEMFWAKHTPKTRKLRCPKCGYKGYCVETYNREEK